MEPNEKSEPSTKLAVQLISSSDKGNYVLVYDLKDGKVVKKFNLEKEVTVLKNWPSIFELLEVECPPNLVKSLLINVYDIPEEVESFPLWFGCLRKFGDLFGYEPVISTTFDITTYTTELLLAKKEGGSYEMGDHVIFARYLTMPSVDLCLMKKQEFGWNVLDTGFVQVNNLSNFKEFLTKNSIKVDQLKMVFITAFVGSEPEPFIIFLSQLFPPNKLRLNKFHTSPNAEYLELYGEYILRIYAGEEYANDYDCFVGNVCFGKYELVCGNSAVVLPNQFKRLPFTVKKKLKITNCKEIKLFVTRGSIFMPLTKALILHEEVNIDSEVVLVTLHIDNHLIFHFKIEKFNSERTLIVGSAPQEQWRDDRPSFVFGKDYCSVNYYKHGLLWKLKDANGNYKIPFKLSFGDEIHVGDAAEEHEEFFLSISDVNMLINEEEAAQLMDSKNIIVEPSGKISFLVKTVDGTRKISSENILAIFMKSIGKLLEEKSGKQMDEVSFAVSTKYGPFLNSSMFAKAHKLLQNYY